MGEKLVERGWRRDDYLDTIRSLNGVIKRQRHSLKALHRSHNTSGKVCAGLARDMQAVRAKQREAATALTLAQARIRELEKRADHYGVALMMIRAGCSDPARFAGNILDDKQPIDIDIEDELP